MMKLALMTAAFAVSMTNAFESTKLQANQTPAPGGFQFLADVTSMGNVLRYAGALAPMYTLVGKELDLNIDYTSDHLEFALKNATITTAEIPAANMTFKEGTDHIVIEIPGNTFSLDIDGHVKGQVSVFAIEADIQNLTLSNVTLNIEVGTSSEDEVIWQLSVEPYFNIENVDMEFKQKIAKAALDAIKPELMKALRYGESVLQGALKGAVDFLNKLLANQTEDMFVVNLKGLLGVPLDVNLTMTRYPEFSAKDNRMTLNFDGLFTKDRIQEEVAERKVFANATGQLQREQIWLHQSMLDSLIYNAKLGFTMEENFDMMKQLFELVPEVFYHYGEKVDCNATVSFPYSKPNQPFTVDKTKGLIIGDTVKGLTAEIQLFCGHNKTEAKELALDMQLGVHGIANITFDNFVYWASFSNASAITANVTSPVVTLEYHDWINEFSYLLIDMQNQFNLAHSEPVDLKKITVIGFIAGIIPGTLLSPFIADEFIMAGFRMIVDPDTPIAARVNEAITSFLQ